MTQRRSATTEGTEACSPAPSGTEPGSSSRRSTWAVLARQLAGVLLPGALGSVLVTIGSVGAGAVLIQDPILSGTLFSAARYGHGRELATATFFVGIALLVVSWVRLGRRVRSAEVGGRAVLLAAAAWTAPLLVAAPLFSKDVYSYLAQGSVALHGLDPYTTGGSAVAGPLSQNVASLWQDTPSPYGPLFVLLSKAVVAVTGENVILGVIMMRLVMLTGLVLVAWAIPGLVRHLGGRTPLALWLTVANPLVITVAVGGAHNDLLMVGLMAVSVLLVLDRRHLLGIGVLALAVAVKAAAIVVLPFLLWVWAARLPGTPWTRLLRAALAGAGVFGAVFTVCSLVAGVDLGWIGVLRSQTPLLTWLSLPSAVGEISFHSIGQLFGGISIEALVAFFRALGLYVLAVVVARQWWLARGGGVEAIHRALIVLMAATVLSPSVLPWYFTWILVLAAAGVWTDRWLSVVAGASVWLVLASMPDGTIVARWSYGAVSPVLWWSYLALTVACGVLAGRALLRRPVAVTGPLPVAARA